MLNANMNINMTCTQLFYFKLVNSLLDALALYTSSVGDGSRIEFILKDKTRFDPYTCFDKIIEAGAFDMIKLIDPTIGIYGEEFGRLGGKSSESLWIVDPIDGTKAFACGSKI